MICYKVVAVGGIGQWDACGFVERAIHDALRKMETDREAVHASTGQEAKVTAHLMNISMVSHEKSLVITVVADVVADYVKGK